MTNGMKSGAGSDPFADDPNGDDVPPDDQDQDPVSKDNSESQSEPTARSQSDQSESSPSKSHTAQEDLPYLFRRRGVKDDRKMVQYFLRDETEDLEREAKQAVEQELGTDVYLTDLREALIRVGVEHVDEVADELRGWGYRYREKKE